MTVRPSIDTLPTQEALSQGMEYLYSLHVMIEGVESSSSTMYKSYIYSYQLNLLAQVGSVPFHIPTETHALTDLSISWYPEEQM